jgi:hypothetical protein
VSGPSRIFSEALQFFPSVLVIGGRAGSRIASRSFDPTSSISKESSEVRRMS